MHVILRGALGLGVRWRWMSINAAMDARPPSLCLAAGDPDWEVTLAWHCHQQLRLMYQVTDPTQGRAIAERVIDSFPTCPIPEVARLGRTLRQWRSHVLARFDTHRISNGGTEAVNLIVEKIRRLAHGFRTFTHYRLRILLAASGNLSYRRTHKVRERKHIRPTLGHLPLAKIDAELLEHFYARLRRCREQCSGRPARGHSNAMCFPFPLRE
jgi:hypothetical protein